MSENETPEANPQLNGISKSMKILVALVFVQMLAIGGMIFLQVTAPAPGAAEAEAEAALAELVFDPVFIEAGPFTVNLTGSAQGAHILFARMLLRADNQETADLLNNRTAEVHNELLMILSSRTAKALTSNGGKQDLVEAIKTGFTTKFMTSVPDIMIGDVLFKDFIVQ